MKITVDLDQLLEQGKISQAEYDKFRQFASHGTAGLAFNILVGFGVIAVGGATLALVPTPATAIVLGGLIAAIGVALMQARYEHWKVLATICVLVGALLFGGGVVVGLQSSTESFLIIAAVFAAAGVFARSSLLVVLSVLALSASLGVKTAYAHAMYALGMARPTLTIVVFGILSLATYHLAKRLRAEHQALAIAASRTGVFLVNFGFWVGSLWGDRNPGGEVVVADTVFSALWAIALIAAAGWAWMRSRRWLVNVVAVFGGIHFYTQWFERLGASPATVLLAGLLALGFAIGLRVLNLEMAKNG
ncbi:MAG TPA: hypothetical protein VNN77_13330 [candidate division Zixibacteria bacterium]|nr:hypothetical protein [candidate division Zixibacteria bacterium]